MVDLTGPSFLEFEISTSPAEWALRKIRFSPYKKFRKKSQKITPKIRKISKQIPEEIQFETNLEGIPKIRKFLP